MPVFLHGLALGNYRGIGPEVQKMGPFRDFNFFIGANNSGKSAVLNFISRHLPLRAGRRPQIEGIEAHRGGTQGGLRFSIGVPVQQFIDNASAAVAEDYHKSSSLRAHISTISKYLSVNDIVWLEVADNGGSPWRLPGARNYRDVEKFIGPDAWSDLWRYFGGYTGGGSIENWISVSISSIVGAQKMEFPATKLIPAIRNVGPAQEQFSDYSGRGLIDRLAEIQNPPYDQRDERNTFDKINSFIKIVTGDLAAEIEIPHDRRHILVHMGGMVLPLEALGTGIHEVVMMAAFCTLSDNEIICIEEPELHLHPLIQKKLINYLRDKTSNQYFIATHSASFIDTAGAAVFHVTRSDLQTLIKESVLRRERFAICADLGHRASDLLQANAVVWVEGPSDRIYVNKWISEIDATLIEGVHYSIMFYGGRLLSHLSADDEAVKEFIDLKALNQNMAILMDSDKSAASAKVNSTKVRIAGEIGRGAGFSWVTKGREIENYVDPLVLHEAIGRLYYDVYDGAVAVGPYDHALYFKRKSPKVRRKASPGVMSALIEKDVDKVAIARMVCEGSVDLGILDLRAKAVGLVKFLQASNH